MIEQCSQQPWWWWWAEAIWLIRSNTRLPLLATGGQLGPYFELLNEGPKWLANHGGANGHTPVEPENLNFSLSLFLEILCTHCSAQCLRWLIEEHSRAQWFCAYLQLITISTWIYAKVNEVSRIEFPFPLPSTFILQQFFGWKKKLKLYANQTLCY